MPAPPAAATPTSVGDLGVRRLMALGRVVVALAIAALASVEAVALPAWVAWLMGLVWLPLASWLWFAEEGPASSARTMAGLLGDVFVIGLLMWLLPSRADAVMVLTVPFVALLTRQWGARAAFAMSAVVLGIRLMVAGARVEGALDAPLVIASVVGYLVVALVVSRAVASQRRDASTVRRFAERSAMILERSSEGIVLTDGDGKILQANPAAQRELGRGPADDLVGQPCASLGLRSADGPLDCQTTCALAALCAHGEDVEVWRVVGDVRRPFLASATELSGDESGAEYMHSFRDITKLRQADEAKTMFLATASHELKTPLTVIRGFTQILASSVTDPQAQVALRAIDTRSAELVSIVDRLLLSSRIEAGRVELATEQVDLGVLLAHRVHSMGATLGRTIELDVREGLTAWANPEALGTALEQLLDNAAKYSPGGQPITVAAHTVLTEPLEDAAAGQDEGLPPAPRTATADEAHGAVVITVTDQGIGMSMEQAERCFEKFWQAEASDVRRFGGTGIGLYIVQSLITEMGGQVTVVSEQGSGSTFTLTLPRDRRGVGTRRVNGASERSSVDDFLHHLGLPAGAS